MGAQPLRILLLDADADLREALADALHSTGHYVVTSAADPATALDLIDSASPPFAIAVIGDLPAPNNNPIQLMTAMQQRAPGAQCLLMRATGIAAPLDALRAGAYCALRKPIDPDELALMIARAGECYHRLAQAERIEVPKLIDTAELARPDHHKELLNMTIERATKLLNARSGGIYEYDAQRGELHLVADTNRSDLLGTVLRVGEGMAGRLVQSNAPFLTVEDYNRWSGRAQMYHSIRPFGAVIEVPLITQNRIVGVLYVDAEVGRVFTSDDARLLRLFADSAAAAIEHAKLAANEMEKLRRLEAIVKTTQAVAADRDEGSLEDRLRSIIHNAELAAGETEKLHRLEAIVKVSNEMFANLGQGTLEDRLQRILKRMAELLNAEHCGISLVKQPGKLTLVASYGHREGSVGQGREFEIRGGPGSGLSGYIAYEGKLFIAHGAELTEHFATRRLEAHHLPSRECFSLLAIPLKHGASGKLLGLLRADNKRDAAGLAGPHIHFTEEDAWIIRFLSDAVVVALEDSRLIDELNEQKDHLHRLIASSPHAVISLDSDGNVNGYNQQAEHILKYTPDQVLRKPVALLYGDPEEARRVGQALAAANGRLTEHESQVRSQDGEFIPIRLTATWLYNARGERVGSVGHFEDLREIKDARRRIELQLRIAERERDMFTKLDEILSRIRLERDVRPLRQQIVRFAIELVGGAGGGLCVNHVWIRELELDYQDRLAPAVTRQSHDHGILGKVARSGEPEICASYHERASDDPMLRGADIATIMAMPLKSAGQVDCVLFVVGAPAAQPFQELEFEILKRFTAHTALILQSAQLMDRNHRQLGWQPMLQQMSYYIQKTNSPDLLARAVLTPITADYGLGLNRAALFRLDEHGYLHGVKGVGHLDRMVAVTDWEDRVQPSRRDYLRFLALLDSGEVAETPIDQPIRQLSLPTKPANRDLFSEVVFRRRERIITTANELAALPAEFCVAFEPDLPLVIVPLIARDKVIGIMVADNKFTHESITPEASNVLLTFMNTAAIAIENGRLFNEAQQAREKLRAFFTAGNALLSSQSLEQALRMIVEQAQAASMSTGVSLFLIDERGQVRRWIAVGDDRQAQRHELVRPNGLSKAIMRDGQPIAIENTLQQIDRMNPSVIKYKIMAALGVPLVLEDRPIGVMWFHYDQPHSFSQAEIDAAGLFAHRAALVYETVRTKTRDTAHAMAAMTAIEQPGQALELIMKSTEDLLGSDAISLYVYDAESSHIQHPPHMRGVRDTALASRYTHLPAPSIIYQMLQFDEPYLAERTLEDPILQHSRFTNDEGIKSCVAIPLIQGSIRVGLMFVNYRSEHQFSDEDLANIEFVAKQSAVAIRNAQLYEREQKLARALKVLYAVGQERALSQDLNTTLKAIFRQALDVVDPLHTRTRTASIRLVEGDGARLIDSHTHPSLRNMRLPMIELFELHGQGGRKIGIIGRAIRLRQPQLVSDVLHDPDYVATDPEARSALAVPIMIRSKIAGVMYFEHHAYDAFDEGDRRAIEMLAGQAAVAIDHARLNTRIEAQAALTWISIAEGVWNHTVRKHAQTIWMAVEQLRADLDLPSRRLVEPMLAMIERNAEGIQQKPVPPALSTVVQMSLNQWLAEYLRQLGEKTQRQECTFQLDPSSQPLMVRAIPFWLKEMFDLLLDNAIKAMRGSTQAQLTISTRRMNDDAAITITDTGSGIPAAIRARLFHTVIDKQAGDTGMGYGAVFAQTIAQFYGGEIAIAASTSSGTSIVVRLPLERTGGSLEL
jgi:PAS domain S-box-containing protein